MFRMNFRGLRMAVVVPLLAAMAALVSVDQASAIHPRGVASRRPAVRIRPGVWYTWLKYIGVTAQTDPKGVLISVIKGSIADQAGLDSGDVIESVDGNIVSSPQQLNEALNAASPNRSATLTVFDVGDPGQPAVSLTLSY
jgi:S1-C subfamily serine protease